MERNTRNTGDLLVRTLICASFISCVLSQDHLLGSARVVFLTNYGDIEFGFFPTVAPKTVDRIFKLVRLGCYNTNHFFRVDKGFVAQVADVAGGRTAPMNEEQRVEAEKTIIGEFSVMKHVRGILSMGILILIVQHLHFQYFLPIERITILSSYFYDTTTETCEEEKSTLERRLTASAIEIEGQRMKCFP